jgi:UrcA family protein
MKMLDHLARIFTVTSLSATLLFAANPLAATETRNITVQSADLNLTKGADRGILQQRITHAVDRICSPDHARTTAEVEASRTCEKLARANAAVQYDAMVARAQTGTKLAGGQKGAQVAE